MKLTFRQLRAEGGCNSYIIGDFASKKACVIDPRVDEMHVYEEFLTRRGLSVAFVLDTHTHADHYSASHLFARELGAKVAMSASTKSARASVLLRDRETLEVSPGLAIEVIQTPGHTPDSLSFIIKGQWGGSVFTGDTLFIGGSGRTDFPGANAGEQFDSLHQRLGMLEGATFVFPGHDYSNLMFSTIAEEIKSNPHLALKNRADFIALKEKEALESGCLVQTIVDFNLKAEPMNRPRAGAHTMCASVAVGAFQGAARATVQQFQEALAEARAGGAIFVDVREPEEFAQSRIEGTINVPMSELFLMWKDLKSASNVHLVCLQGNRSLVAAQTLARIGLSNVIDVQGGLLAWTAAGFQIKKA